MGSRARGKRARSFRDGAEPARGGPTGAGGARRYGSVSPRSTSIGARFGGLHEVRDDEQCRPGFNVLDVHFGHLGSYPSELVGWWQGLTCWALPRNGASTVGYQEAAVAR